MFTAPTPTDLVLTDDEDGSRINMLLENARNRNANDHNGHINGNNNSTSSSQISARAVTLLAPQAEDNLDDERRSSTSRRGSHSKSTEDLFSLDSDAPPGFNPAEVIKNLAQNDEYS
jgi:hypothetical protein